MLIHEQEDPALFHRIQEQNLRRQYALLTDCIEIGIQQGPASFDKYLHWSLNHVAVANLRQLGGRFRQEPIHVGTHSPPHFKDVDVLMDQYISHVQEDWFVSSPTALAAYGLWRLNWIHPFVDGNGRTARAICYFLLCVRTGAVLPGRKIIPERIRETRPHYVHALRTADAAWENGTLDVSVLEEYLASLLGQQLQDQ